MNTRWLYWTLLLMLFVQPLWFSVVGAMLGIVALWQRWRISIWPFVLAIVFGALSQALGPSLPYRPLPAPESTTNSIATTNLIAPYDYADLSSWDSTTQQATRAQRLLDGFLKAQRYKSDGQEFSEIVTFRSYAVNPNQPYTLSFYFRTDGRDPRFRINFVTPRGFIAVPATIVPTGNGIYRASASMVTQTRDTSIRGLNLLGFSGEWSYIDIAYIQLEPSSGVSIYTAGGIKPNLLERSAWWIGSVCLAYLLLLAFSWLLTRVKPYEVIWLTLTGLTVQLLFSIIQTVQGAQRATGLLEVDNYLGHFAVACAALIWLLGRGSYSVLLGLLLSLALVFLSESRAALIGWSLVMLAYIWDNQKYWKWFLAAVPLLAFLGWLSNTTVLGRLATIGDLSYFTTQARVQIWEIAQQAFATNPVTGIGFNRFNVYYLENIPLSLFETSAAHPHSLLWQLLSESGILGLLGFLILWSWVIIQLVRAGQGAVIALISMILLLNMFDLTWFTAGIHSLLWLSVAYGLSLMPSRLPKTR